MQVIGNQIVDQFPINNWTTPTLTYGLTYLPPSYSTSTQSYPLIIHLEGLGEIGTGITGLNKLLNTSLPQRIAQGFQPAAINPVDKQSYEFIVVSPQGATGSYQWLYLQYILADITKRYRVDKTRIYITGYSSGGWGTWTCVTDSLAFCKLIAAVAPVSSEPVESAINVNGTIINRVANVTNAAIAGTAVWSICGAQDSFITYANQYTTAINAAKPTIPAVLTSLPGVGHSAWNQAYDPNWTDPAMKLNLYQWLLQYKLGGSPVVVPPISVTYSNTATSASFTRNNCGSTFTGLTVVYPVSAGKFTSTISQADADAQAQADITSNGQTYANAKGTCTPNLITTIQVFADGTIKQVTN